MVMTVADAMWGEHVLNLCFITGLSSHTPLSFAPQLPV